VRVYKFLSAKWGRVALRKKRLKASRVSNLNDLFDLRGIVFPTETETNVWRNYVNQIGNHPDKPCCIVSFSETFANSLMWAHYAESGTGIALGFDLHDEGAIKVLYREAPSRFNSFSGHSIDEKRKIMRTAFSTKSDDWSYEKEVRWIVTVDEKPDEKGNLFVEFGPEFKLREVILGPKYSGQQRYLERIVDKGIYVRGTKLHATEFKIIVDN